VLTVQLRGVGKVIDTFQQPGQVEVFRGAGLMNRLVVDGDVVDQILTLRIRLVGAEAVHAAQAVLDDVRHLIAERRVIVHHRRIGAGEQRRVTIGVLQTLAGQRCPTSGGAHQEAPRELVRHRPDRITGALEPEHRIEDVERDHRLAMHGVRRSGGDG